MKPKPAPTPIPAFAPVESPPPEEDACVGSAEDDEPDEDVVIESIVMEPVFVDASSDPDFVSATVLGMSRYPKPLLLPDEH
ncbi:hypothetical protein HG531_010774 [Fusarium graminearum]|nr:hypothetical protein HG531_010774 [Fusarium graminearum]